MSADKTREIVNFYNKGKEDNRLHKGHGLLEKARMIRILNKVIPTERSTIYDIGGGTGIYAIPLAIAGHEVHLFDLIESHIDLAKSKLKAEAPEKNFSSCIVGDAKKLPYKENVADVVLLLGPLYHLIEPKDRKLALDEAYRILKPSGILIASAISRYASLFDGISKQYLNDPDFVTIVQQAMNTGHHRGKIRDDAEKEYFTHSYFHYPADLKNELENSKFNNIRLKSIESATWNVDAVVNIMNSETSSILLDFLDEIEDDPSIIGASSHFLAIAEKK